jgi:hypothetical protein
MKSLYLLSFLLLMPLLSQAQYKSVFGKKSTSWNVLTEIADGNNTDSINCSEDSLVNGKSYKLVEHRYSILCLIREDTVTGRVWILQKGKAKEDLVMDLNLQIGDSFPLFYDPSFDTTYNVRVVSILHKDNRKYISFDIRNTLDSNYFMEGIGPSVGFFYKIVYGYPDYFGGEDYLLCAYKDSDRVYVNNSFNSKVRGRCRVSFAGLKEEPIQKSLEIYPNPAASSINFQFNNTEAIASSVYVYDQLGRLADKVITNTNIIQISKGNKPAGIYYYRLLQYDQLISSGKIEFVP